MPTIITIFFKYFEKFLWDYHNYLPLLFFQRMAGNNENKIGKICNLLEIRKANCSQRILEDNDDDNDNDATIKILDREKINQSIINLQMPNVL